MRCTAVRCAIVSDAVVHGANLGAGTRVEAALLGVCLALLLLALFKLVVVTAAVADETKAGDGDGDDRRDADDDPHVEVLVTGGAIRVGHHAQTPDEDADGRQDGQHEAHANPRGVADQRGVRRGQGHRVVALDVAVLQLALIRGVGLTLKISDSVLVAHGKTLSGTWGFLRRPS